MPYYILYAPRGKICHGYLCGDAFHGIEMTRPCKRPHKTFKHAHELQYLQGLSFLLEAALHMFQCLMKVVNLAEFYVRKTFAN